MKRDPTDVELFDIAQSNSEHSRHWFFGGNMIIDGEKKSRSLFRIVKDTLTPERRKNSVIAFDDNSSAIRGFDITTIQPECPGKPSKFIQEKFMSHILLSAETHNFPSGVTPFLYYEDTKAEFNALLEAKMAEKWVKVNQNALCLVHYPPSLLHKLKTAVANCELEALDRIQLLKDVKRLCDAQLVTPGEVLSFLEA